MNKNLLLWLMLLCAREIVGQEFKVISFNIRYDNPDDKEDAWEFRKAELASFLVNAHPAFAGIQEALNSQVDFLENELPGYKFIGVGRDDGQKQGEYSPIFYDANVFELMQQSTFWLSTTPEVVSTGWDAALPRICTYGLFRHKALGTTLWVFNTHFDHVGEEAREKSAELILSKMEELNMNRDYPILLMGDLNATANEKPIQLFKNELREAKSTSKLILFSPEGTFNGFNTNEPVTKCIDYIFIKSMDMLIFEHRDAKRESGRYLSDHLPIIALLKMHDKNK